MRVVGFVPKGTGFSHRLLFLLFLALNTVVYVRSLSLSSLQASLKSTYSLRLSPLITFHKSEGIGLKSVSPIPSGTLIMSAPSSSSIKTTTPISIFDVPKDKTYKEWNNMEWEDRLAYKLSLIPDSEYKSALPSTFKKWNLPSSYPLEQPGTPDRFKKLVYSRTFSSPPLPTFNPIPPLTLTTLSLVTYFLHLTTLSQIADASGLTLCYIILSDFVFPKFKDEIEHRILPGIDFFNHCTAENCEVKKNYFNGGEKKRLR